MKEKRGSQNRGDYCQRAAEAIIARRLNDVLHVAGRSVITPAVQLAASSQQPAEQQIQYISHRDNHYTVIWDELWMVGDSDLWLYSIRVFAPCRLRRCVERVVDARDGWLKIYLHFLDIDRYRYHLHSSHLVARHSW